MGEAITGKILSRPRAKLCGDFRGSPSNRGEGASEADGFEWSLDGGRGAALGDSYMLSCFGTGSGFGDVICCGPFGPNDAASFSISGRGEYGEGGGVCLTSELDRLFRPCRVSARLSASPFLGDAGGVGVAREP